MKYIFLFVFSVLFPHCMAGTAKAGEWGCEVLLCAASANPSWHSVESCHPPMEKLISAMKSPGFSWPTCPEGGAGEPGYEKYAECPPGWNPANARAPQDRIRPQEPSQCARTVKRCKSRYSHFGNLGGRRRETTKDGVTRIFSGNNSCIYREYKRRPLRTDPYYFDIRDDATGEHDRYWFSLQP
ncbi:hypothetical protein [Rhizobium sp. Root482]|uniref:hypothetical protein n=1 Tax=Rhizobium sp. Root482 TaxID=1736543 RepID=UPI000AB5D6C6|nr:hypothetical protein [Rhizobium sp. Root482]